MDKEKTTGVVVGAAGTLIALGILAAITLGSMGSPGGFGQSSACQMSPRVYQRGKGHRCTAWGRDRAGREHCTYYAER